ncbi:ATP-dependent RNA helicase DbpA [Bdellovibrio sp. 22V]|uniref:ATP-dependent RNA helicase DbpA n=1 Tax=Bdellovibrio TaxID=958 RepID=UPI0025426BE7|nr:ATP-dependent RNA helicase DbpA [Bdellovibrio sp. 22V]WII71481.1 ATP-dependent RNA helicase DbpA [Bdellovibrio sp. 22V]
MNSFLNLPLSAELLAVVQELGFEQMTPIQAESIPHLLAGKDFIGQSRTGSGKTAAFALPILHKLDLQNRSVQAIVICPTRELTTQVVNDIRKLGRRLEGLQVLPLVGGQPSRPQAEALENGVHLVVGTPGRILEHIQRGRMDLANLDVLVLDEADKMLELGFDSEMKSILNAAPKERQTVLFSATFPDGIESLSRKYQKNPLRVTIEEEESPTSSIEQWVYETKPEDKVGTLMRVLQQHPSESTVIFCNTKNDVASLSEKFTQNKVLHSVLHGDLEQKERDRALALFRNGSHRILVATDVAARGLDIENLELVVNFDLPTKPETYVHRIGRTGRAGKQGVAVTLAEAQDTLELLELEKAAGSKFKKQNLGFKNQTGLNKNFRGAVMQTISISGGRKDKLRPGDILGALTGASGGLSAEQVGKIEIHDKISYVAIAADVAKVAFDKLRDGRIKGQKFQIKIVK